MDTGDNDTKDIENPEPIIISPNTTNGASSTQQEKSEKLEANDVYPQAPAPSDYPPRETTSNTDQAISDMNMKETRLKKLFIMAGILLLTLLISASAVVGWYLYSATNKPSSELVAYEFDDSKRCYWADGEIVTSTVEIRETNIETRMIPIDEENAFVQEAQEKGWCITKVTGEKTNQVVATPRVVDSDVPQSSLKTMTYPATSRNPSYELLFFPDTTGVCNDATGYCGRLIADTGDGEFVHLAINDLSKYNDGHLAIVDDGQCKESSINAHNSGAKVAICEAGFGGGVVYYKFQLELGTKQHVGTFSGVNPKGQTFLDVSSFNDELIEIIESLKLL